MSDDLKEMLGEGLWDRTVTQGPNPTGFCSDHTHIARAAKELIEQLERERDVALAAQNYSYIGKDMKPILARDMEDAKDEAEAKLAKAVDKLTKAEAYLQKISRHANRSCSAIAARALAELEGGE
jgi:hypothetical protein